MIWQADSRSDSLGNQTTLVITCVRFTKRTGLRFTWKNSIERHETWIFDELDITKKMTPGSVRKSVVNSAMTINHSLTESTKSPANVDWPIKKNQFNRVCSCFVNCFYWPIKKNRFIRVIFQELWKVLCSFSHAWSAGYELSNGYKQFTDWKHSFMSQFRESFWLT